MRYAAECDPIAAFGWDEDLWRIWVLGFTLHDYTKAGGINVAASQLEAIRSICTQIRVFMHFERFFPDWRNYLDEIVYLAQNVQTVEEANLNLRSYHLRHDRFGPRQRDAACMLG